MASHALALYQAASSPYNLDGDLSFTWDDLVREETLTLEATPPHFHHQQAMAIARVAALNPWQGRGHLSPVPR
jgi:hypothetical protein